MANEITVIQGDSIVLNCSLHATPKPTIIWTKNDQILFKSDRFCRYERKDALFRIILFFSLLIRIFIYDENSQLYIINASLDDRGRYQCQAENLAGRSRQFFDVQIHCKPYKQILNLKLHSVLFEDPPEIHSETINLNPFGILGKSITLSCHAFGVPAVNYQWLKDKRDIFDSNTYAR